MAQASDFVGRGAAQPVDRRNDPVSYSSWGEIGGVGRVNGQVGKFVPETSIGEKKRKEVEANIQTVQSAFDAVNSVFKGVKESLDWKWATPTDIATYPGKLAELEIKFSRQSDLRRGIGGIDKQLSNIDDKAVIPDVTHKYQTMEMGLLQYQKTGKRVKALCENQTFQEAYTLYKDKLEGLKNLVASSWSIDRKIASLSSYLSEAKSSIQAQATACQLLRKNGQIRTIKKLHLEVTSYLFQAANQIKQAILPLDENAATQTTDINGRIQEVTDLATAIKDQLQRIPKKPLPAPAAQVITDEALNQFQVPRLEKSEIYFGFWSHTFWGAWSSYKTGWYVQTGLIATQMEAEVSYKVAGLLREVEKRLIKLAQGNTLPISGKATLKDELDYYQNVMLTLQTRLSNLQAQVGLAPLDKLAPYVINYGQGLEEALGNVRRQLKICYDLSANERLDVLNSEQWLFAHFLNTSFSEIPELKSLQKVEGLYQAAKLMANAGRIDSKSETISDKYVLLLASILKEMHAQKDRKALVLVDGELDVFSELISAADLDILRYESEAKDQLPTVIKSYILKKITQVLYLADLDYDIEFELVLHTLRSNPRYFSLYRQTLLNQPLFQDAINTYEARFQEARLTQEQLNQACALFKISQDADQAIRDPLRYALSWQRYAEFSAAHKGDLDRRTQIDLLLGLVKARFALLAKDQGYVNITHARIQDSDLTTWDVCANPDLFTGFLLSYARESRDLRQEGVELEVLQKRQLQAYLLRALACCLYGNNEQEWKFAHRQVMEILENPVFEGLRADLPEDIMVMVYENTINKVIDTAHIGRNELELLKKGPISRLIASNVFEFADAKLQHALFSLVRKEQKVDAPRPLTAALIEQKGAAAFERWYASYKQLLINEEMSKLFAKLVLSEQPGVLAGSFAGARAGRGPAYSELLKREMSEQDFNAWLDYHKRRQV